MKRKMKLCQIWNGSFSSSACALSCLRSWVNSSTDETFLLLPMLSWLGTCERKTRQNRKKKMRQEIALQLSSFHSRVNYEKFRFNGRQCKVFLRSLSSGPLQLNVWISLFCMLKRWKREIRQWKVFNDITTCCHWIEVKFFTWKDGRLSRGPHKVVHNWETTIEQEWKVAVQWAWIR